MKQEKERSRVFLIPEASYDERTENLASMYSMLKMIIKMARMTGELAMNGKGVKRSFKWLLQRCDKFDTFADLILKESGIPLHYAESKDRAELEDRKASEIFIDGLLDGDGEDEDEDEDDGLIEYDDYDDVYNAGFFFDDEDSAGGGISCNDLERIADEVYAMREEATQCVVGASEIIRSADDFIEALSELKYRLNE